MCIAMIAMVAVPLATTAANQAFARATESICAHTHTSECYVTPEPHDCADTPECTSIYETVITAEATDTEEALTEEILKGYNCGVDTAAQLNCTHICANESDCNQIVVAESAQHLSADSGSDPDDTLDAIISETCPDCTEEELCDICIASIEPIVMMLIGNIKYTITYNGNGHTSGDVPVDVNEYEPDEQAVIAGAGTMEKNDESLIGWNTKADGSGDFFGIDNAIPMTESLNLYAIWQSANVKVGNRTEWIAAMARLEAENLVVEITESFAYSTLVIIPSNRTLTLVGSGELTSSSNHFIIRENGTLILNNGVTLKGDGVRSGGISNSGTFIMYGGIITGCVTRLDNSTVYNTGTVIMYGGKISGNSSGVGGGVRVQSAISENASFIMYGGEISDNTAATGGGVTSNGLFIMNGGKISGNTAGMRGGGVSNSWHGVFIMNGGEISGNSAAREGGGGVSNWHGSMNTSDARFTMNGGIISGNSSAGNGAGVQNERGTFTMNGGKISGNTATSGGGGLWSNNTSIVNHGEISGNRAGWNGGGGVWIQNYTDLTVGANVVFSGNKATAAHERNPDNDAVYASNIRGTQWTTPFTQGYNNFDINNTSGSRLEFYKVTFEDYDGTVIKTETVLTGYDATPPANTSREGWQLIGWDGDYTNVTEDRKLTAQYEQLIHTVTFFNWNDDVLGLQTVTHGNDATAPIEPMRSGYDFTGWDIDFKNVKSNLYVTALFTEITPPPVTPPPVTPPPVTPPPVTPPPETPPPIVTLPEITTPEATTPIETPPVVLTPPTVTETVTVVVTTPATTTTADTADEDEDEFVMTVPATTGTGDTAAGDGGTTTTETTDAPENNAFSITDEEPPLESLQTEITDASTPLGGLSFTVGGKEIPVFGAIGQQTWSLFNLLFTIAGLITAAFVAIRVLKQKRQEENDENMQHIGADSMTQKINFRHIRLAAGILAPVAAILVFLLTQDVTLQVALMDRLTIVHAILFAVTIAAAVPVKKDNEDESGYNNYKPAESAG